MIGRARVLRRTHDTARFIDPHRLRHVHHAVQIGDAMLGIDQAPVLRARLLDPLPRMFRTAAFLRDRHDHEFFRFRLSNICCHTGKSKRQPHQEAQVQRNTFSPRNADSVCGTPARSGSVKSGAINPASARCAVPRRRQAPRSRRPHHAPPGGRAIARTPRHRRGRRARRRRHGTQSSSRHMPSGFSVQPVARCASSADSHRPFVAATVTCRSRSGWLPLRRLLSCPCKANTLNGGHASSEHW